jgi:ABC-2 type transport system ATP-binding protein
MTLATTPVIDATGLTKRYPRTVALRGIDLEVGAGEVVGLLGPNGAGKSTLTKVLCGLVRPDSGAATIAGAPVGSLAARAKVGYLAELFRFPGWSSADEVLATHQRLCGHPGGASAAADRERLLTEVGLWKARDTRVEAMSKGMQQRLGLAQAMLGEPAALLLDEPTSALDPAGRHTVREVLSRARDRGTAILLNTHLLGEVEQLADRVVLIDQGSVITAGRTADLTAGVGVTVETDHGTAEYAGTTREEIPDLIARLMADGRKVFAVTPHRSTLEELYLERVGDREIDR